MLAGHQMITIDMVRLAAALVALGRVQVPVPLVGQEQHPLLQGHRSLIQQAAVRVLTIMLVALIRAMVEIAQILEEAKTGQLVGQA